MRIPEARIVKQSYTPKTLPPIIESMASALLDSPDYPVERQWLIDNLGIDIDLLRRDPAFWLGLNVGSHVDKMSADLGLSGHRARV